MSAVTGSTICLDNEDNVEVRYITDTLDTIDEEYLKDINVNFGEKYGPVNSIVLSRSGESDNVYLQDEESVATNGITELKIVDNQIMNFNNRADFLPDILSKLNGLEYYLNDFVSTGITYYDICDRYNVKVGDNIYSCILFDDEILITQGLEENIFTERPENSETDYKKSDKDDRKINQAYIIVDKQNQTITGLVSKIESNDTTINNNYQEIINRFEGLVTEEQLESYQKSMQLQMDANELEISKIETAIINGVEKVVTTSGSFDENGLTMEQTGANTKTVLDETGVNVKDTQGIGNDLLFAGYVDEERASENESLKSYEGQTIVYSQNMIIDNYLTIGTHSRIEDYEDGTGIFYLD